MWADAVEKKMYITGGVGTTGNEGFGEPYSLPNISAYAETCAVLMFITLNHRLFLATGDSKYIDVMERGMYNNALSGVSASGDRFFYVNRLASAGDGRDERWQQRVARMLPAQPRAVPGVDAGLRLRAGPGRRDLREPLRVERDVVQGQRAAARRSSVAERDAVGWPRRESRVTTDADVAAARSSCGFPAGRATRSRRAGCIAYSDQDDEAASVSVNGTRVAAAPDALGYVSLEPRRGRTAT